MCDKTSQKCLKCSKKNHSRSISYILSNWLGRGETQKRSIWFSGCSIVFFPDYIVYLYCHSHQTFINHLLGSKEIKWNSKAVTNNVLLILLKMEES